MLIFGAPEEKPLAEAIAQKMERPPAIVAGRTTLRQLMGLLAECQLIVTNDSGPMHLAAALGVPLVDRDGEEHEGDERDDETRAGTLAGRRWRLIDGIHRGRAALVANQGFGGDFSSALSTVHLGARDSARTAVCWGSEA